MSLSVPQPNIVSNAFPIIKYYNYILHFFSGICRTMPMRKILLLWISFSETQQCLVSCFLFIQKYNYISIKSHLKSLFAQNLRGHQRWRGWTSSLALEASVDFASASALFLSLRLSFGSRLSSAESSNCFKIWFLVWCFNVNDVLFNDYYVSISTLHMSHATFRGDNFLAVQDSS